MYWKSQEEAKAKRFQDPKGSFYATNITLEPGGLVMKVASKAGKEFHLKQFEKEDCDELLRLFRQSRVQRVRRASSTYASSPRPEAKLPATSSAPPVPRQRSGVLPPPEDPDIPIDIPAVDIPAEELVQEQEEVQEQEGVQAFCPWDQDDNDDMAEEQWSEEEDSEEEAGKDGVEKKEDDIDDLIDPTISMEPGEYRVQVNIIEVRELKPKSKMMSKGKCNPLVCVELLGQKKYTSSRSGMDVTFDQLLTFNFGSLSRDRLDGAEVTISVHDKGYTSRSKSVIGHFQTDLQRVYCAKDGSHEMYRQWAALFSENSHNSEPQGYIKFTISVLGPHDRIKVHNVEDDIKKEQQKQAMGTLDLLRPPQVKQELCYLVVQVHHVEDLVKLCKHP